MDQTVRECRTQIASIPRHQSVGPGSPNLETLLTKVNFDRETLLAIAVGER
jgi:hypothetical protein